MRATLALVTYDLPFFKNAQLVHEEHRRQLAVLADLHLPVA